MEKENYQANQKMLLLSVFWAVMKLGTSTGNDLCQLPIKALPPPS